MVCCYTSYYTLGIAPNPVYTLSGTLLPQQSLTHLVGHLFVGVPHHFPLWPCQQVPVILCAHSNGKLVGWLGDKLLGVGQSEMLTVCFGLGFVY